ncbi:hypothetical protein [Pontibacterium sp.]|uniref:hypothetical protein n=1 Tax=Pontibacterium sp. TaxID=2036026 RepID=UPI00351530B7
MIRNEISDRPVAATYELTEFGRSALLIAFFLKAISLIIILSQNLVAVSRQPV